MTDFVEYLTKEEAEELVEALESVISRNNDERAFTKDPAFSKEEREAKLKEIGEKEDRQLALLARLKKAPVLNPPEDGMRRFPKPDCHLVWSIDIRGVVSLNALVEDRAREIAPKFRKALLFDPNRVRVWIEKRDMNHLYGASDSGFDYLVAQSLVTATDLGLLEKIRDKREED